jgi:hypothetical protein
VILPPPVLPATPFFFRPLFFAASREEREELEEQPVSRRAAGRLMLSLLSINLPHKTTLLQTTIMAGSVV